MIFSVFIDILLVLTSIAFYYAVLIHNPKVASGIFYVCVDEYMKRRLEIKLIHSIVVALE